MRLEDLLRTDARHRAPSLRRARVVNLTPLQVTLDGETTPLDVADAPNYLAVGQLVQVAFVGRKLTIQGGL